MAQQVRTIVAKLPLRFMLTMHTVKKNLSPALHMGIIASVGPYSHTIIHMWWRKREVHA